MYGLNGDKSCIIKRLNGREFILARFFVVGTLFEKYSYLPLLNAKYLNNTYVTTETKKIEINCEI